MESKGGTEDLISIQSTHGVYMRADSDYLYADKQKKLADVKKANLFTPVSLGDDLIALLTNYGKYVVCENGGTADANRGRVGAWEKFKVVKQDKCKKGFAECVGFYNPSHKFWLTATQDGKVNCN